jgi:hypothetical protein
MDLSSLAVTKHRRGSGSSAPASDGKSATLRSHVLPIRDEEGARRASLKWLTLPSNNDRPPVCAGCETRVSDLVLHVLQCEGMQGEAP